MKIIRLAFVQRNASYIKGNITKYIAPKLFYGDIEILQTKSWDLQDSEGDSLLIITYTTNHNHQIL